jgi:hypothetical protein
MGAGAISLEYDGKSMRLKVDDERMAAVLDRPPQGREVH